MVLKFLLKVLIGWECGWDKTLYSNMLFGIFVSHSYLIHLKVKSFKITTIIKIFNQPIGTILWKLIKLVIINVQVYTVNNKVYFRSELAMQTGPYSSISFLTVYQQMHIQITTMFFIQCCMMHSINYESISCKQ